MINVCWLDADAWQQLQGILERRSTSQQQAIATQPVASDHPPLITNDHEGVITNGKFAVWTRLIASVAYLQHLLTSDISPLHPLYKLKKQLSVLFFNFRAMFTQSLFLPHSQAIP